MLCAAAGLSGVVHVGRGLLLIMPRFWHSVPCDDGMENPTCVTVRRKSSVRGV